MSGVESRTLLRVYSGHGRTGLPFLDQETGGFTNPFAPGAGASLSLFLAYIQEVALPAVAGIAIGIICLIAACIIWYCRCCCNSCCKGDPDPESKHTPVRIIIAVLSGLAFAGSIIGLVGGVLMSNAIRTFVTDATVIGTRYKLLIDRLTVIIPRIGVSPNIFNAVSSYVSSALSAVQLISQFITPFDVARLFILYLGMSLSMLAAITLGFGVILRRKQITQTGFVCSAIALVFCWFTFGINLPLSILLDDSCQTAENIVAFQSATNGQIGFLLQCSDTASASNLLNQVRSFARSTLGRARTSIDRINAANAPRVIYDRPPAATDIDVCMMGPGGLWTRASATCFQQILTDAYNNTFPDYAACGASSSCLRPGNDHALILAELQNMALAREGLELTNELIDCNTITTFVNGFRMQICTTLVIGVLLVFVGSLVVGAPLIPAVLMALWVNQKFPNRAAAAKLKSRLMVIFSFQFFHAIVALAGELRPDIAEVVLSAITIVMGALGFALLNAPMNKLDWSPAKQMFLAFVLALIEAGLTGGWIYLLYTNASQVERCVNVLYRGNIFLLNPANMATFPPVAPGERCLNSNYYTHILLVSILSATSTIVSMLGMVTGIVLIIQIKCGYQLNLADSDFELD